MGLGGQNLGCLIPSRFALGSHSDWGLQGPPGLGRFPSTDQPGFIPILGQVEEVGDPLPPHSPSVRSGVALCTFLSGLLKPRTYPRPFSLATCVKTRKLLREAPAPFLSPAKVTLSQDSELAGGRD